MKYNKVAIVYDWIDKWGGAERVLLALAQMFPDADFYTSYYDSSKATWATHLNIKTSFIQQLPRFIKTNRALSVPLYPFAFESLDLTSYDLVISVTSSYAKSVITRPDTLHICYMLSPTRFLWDQPEAYTSSLLQRITRPYANYLKSWDLATSARPDKIITISNFVQNNIQKYYDRKSDVIYPPFDYQYWQILKNTSTLVLSKNRSNYYLTVSRLEPYKKIDLVIKTFNNLNKRLIIIGKGSQSYQLRAFGSEAQARGELAKSNVSFLEDVSDKELAEYYMNARALIMPQKEEFGYTALEAQFFGCPVISYAQGGVRETVLDGKTGIFFSEQSQKSLHDALEKFESIYYTLSKSAKLEGPKQAEKFDFKKFTKDFMNYVESSQ